MSAPTAIAAGGAVLGAMGGGQQGTSTRVVIPPDMRGTRQYQIDLLNWLTGGPVAGQGQPSQQQPSRTPQPTRGYAPGTNAQNPGLGGSYGGGTGTGSKSQPFQAPDGAELYNRIQQFFGPLGAPTTGLQQQSTDAISKFLAQPAPEQRAMDISLPALQGILGQKPGQGLIDAYDPTYQRSLAAANQSGNRFGSANAVLRSRALDDYNLFAANAYNQGVGQQLNAAQALGMLSQAAGQNPFQRMTGAYEIGKQQSAQLDIETQRRLQILLQMLGTAQSASLGLPITQTQNGNPWAGALNGAATASGVYHNFQPGQASA